MERDLSTHFSESLLYIAAGYEHFVEKILVEDLEHRYGQELATAFKSLVDSRDCHSLLQ
jgi:hypothetical protein